MASPIMGTMWPRLLFLFTVVSIVEAMLYGSLSAFSPLHLPDIGVPRSDVQAWIGGITSFASLVSIPLAPLWGTLADRYSRKLIIVRSFVVHVVAATVMLLAPSIWVFAIGRALLGFASGDTALMLATIADRTPTPRRGFAFAVVNGSLSVGSLLGTLLGGPIFDRFGFTVLLACMVVLLMAVILGLTLGYHEVPRARTTRPILTMAVESVRIITGSRALRTIFFAQFLVGTSWMLVSTFSALVITSYYGGPDPGTTVGIVLAIGGVGTILFGPLIGSIADRVGYWRMLLTVSSSLLLAWLALSIVRGLGAYIPIWAVATASMAAVSSLSFNVISNLVDDESRGRIMAFVYLPLNFGSVVGPILGGVIATRNLFAIFPAAALCVMLSLYFFWRARSAAT